MGIMSSPPPGSIDWGKIMREADKGWGSKIEADKYTDYWDWYDRGPGSETWKIQIRDVQKLANEYLRMQEKVSYLKIAQEQTREKLKPMYDVIKNKDREEFLPKELFEI